MIYYILGGSGRRMLKGWLHLIPELPPSAVYITELQSFLVKINLVFDYTIMNQSDELDHPYKGQKFTSFEHLKKYLKEYGQRNYVRFWIRSSHKRNSLKRKMSKNVNPNLKYVSIKFACIFGGEKIRCRGTGLRKSSTYRNLGCPCMINAVVGEDGNHVKLDTVILNHNHVLCKTLYDSLKNKRKKVTKLNDSISKNVKISSHNYTQTDFANEKNVENHFKDISLEKTEMTKDIQSVTANSLKYIQDEHGFKILVVNSEKKDAEQIKPNFKINNEVLNNSKDIEKSAKICRLCLSSKDQLSPIFNPDLPLKSTVLSFKIMGCASIDISRNDGLPNNICTTCEANLDIAYNFRVTCENSDSILREMHARGQFHFGKDYDSYLKNENLDEEYVVPESSINIPAPQDTKEANETSNEIPSQEPVYLEFAISCPVCAYEFETYETMLEHLDSHSKEETLLACNICAFVCSSIEILTSHMTEHLQQTVSEVIKCGICGMEFGIPEELKSHESEHEPCQVKKVDEMRFLCNVCGKIFKTKDRFQTHRNMHEGLRPHVCVGCGRGFADRKNLHQHYDVVHLRKVRHECPVCQRKFYTRTKMKSHMTMHSGIKPFTCDVCNKTFRLKMNMNKHKKTHTNERPYQCDKCNAAFIEKNLLRRHSYKHGGVRPFRCPVCGHGFSARFCLKKHLKESKCRSVAITVPETYQWLDVSQTDPNLSDNKCVVLYKSEEGDILQEEPQPVNLGILEEYKDNT